MTGPEPTAHQGGEDPLPEQADFKQCTLCGTVWQCLRDFVTDADLRVEGYQACFEDPAAGLILVTHEREGCSTTLAVPAAELRGLHDGPVWTERRTGLDDCLRLCLDKGRLEECTADCALAWVRSVLQWLRRHEWPPHAVSSL